MSSLFDRITGKNRQSASAAKERLQLVLSHDRTKLPPGVMQDIKDEIIDVISRHIDIDRTQVRIEMEQEGRQQSLVADIPLTPPRRRRN